MCDGWAEGNSWAPRGPRLRACPLLMKILDTVVLDSDDEGYIRDKRN
jgi:hypothetical protein